jgi:drug/metabolite transporter (DMT)-like permease
MRQFFNSTIFLAIVACLLWSSAFASVKVGLQYNTPLQFAGIRFFISGLLLLPFALRQGNFISIVIKNFRFIVWISLLQIFLLYALFYHGLNLVPAAIGAIVVGSGPLFVALLTHFFMQNDRLTLRKSLSMLLGFAGIVVVSLSRNASQSPVGNVILWGVLILLISNTIGGISNIVIANAKGKVPSYILSSTTLAMGGIFLFLFSIPFEGVQLGPFPTNYWIALTWLSFLSAGAFTIWFNLLRRPGVKVSVLNMWKFIIPIFGAILSWIIIPDEKPTLQIISGMVLTSISLILITIDDRRHKV